MNIKPYFLMIFLAVTLCEGAISSTTLEMKRKIHLQGAKSLCISSARGQDSSSYQAAFGLLYLGLDNDIANEKFNTAMLEVAESEKIEDFSALIDLFEPNMFFWIRVYHLFSDTDDEGKSLNSDNKRLLLDLFNAFYDKYAGGIASMIDSDYWLVSSNEMEYISKVINLYLAADILKNNSHLEAKKEEFGISAEKLDEFLIGFIKNRAGNGLFATVSSVREGGKLNANLVNLYDFSSNEETKRGVSVLLELIWAEWAQDCLGFYRAGARSCSDSDSKDTLQSFVMPFISPNMDWANARGYASISDSFIYVAATTSWRMPDIVMDMILDEKGMGEYEYISQVPAVAKKLADDQFKLLADQKMLKRYSYRGNDYILGAFLPDPMLAICTDTGDEGYLPSAVNNVIQGLRLSNGEYLSVKSNGYLPQAVQYKNILIFQQPKISDDIQSLHIEISDNMKRTMSQRGGWLLFESSGTRVAVKGLSLRLPGVACGYDWQPDGKLILREQQAPLVIITAAVSQYRDLDEFVFYITEHNTRIRDNLLSYECSDIQGEDAVLTLSLDCSEPPKINGKPFGSSELMLFDSPFMRSAKGTGVITLKKNARKTVYNTNTGQVIDSK